MSIEILKLMFWTELVTCHCCPNHLVKKWDTSKENTESHHLNIS